MSERFDQLTARHSKLRAHCAVQRRHLAQTAGEIESRLGRIDRGVNVVRGLARNPALIAGSIAIVALIGPKRVLRWAGRGVLLVSTARRLMRLARPAEVNSRRESSAAIPLRGGGSLPAPRRIP